MATPGPVICFLSRLFGVASDEAPAVAAGVLMFFLLFAGYFMLRPVRETMGIAGGVENLQWLFTGTFMATLAAIPLFGWIAARAPRRRILPWTYGFFALNLLGFAAAVAAQPDNPWIARAFYIWLSVFTLLVISVAWSVLADLFPVTDAKLLSPDEVKMSIHYTFERWTRLQNLSYKFGKEKSSITEYEKVTLLNLHLNGNLFLLSIDPNADYMGIISKTNSIIAEFQN